MIIKLNNQSVEIPQGSSLQSILDAHFGDQLRGHAVAVNENLVIRAAQSTYVLQPGDDVLVVKATQGG